MARRSNRYSPAAGDQYPVPEASPRSVAKRPVSRQVSQSWGRSTFANRAQCSGSLRCSHDSLVIVNAATGTLPQASAHAAAPPGSCFSSQPASGADSVSFQSLAGRTTSPAASSTTMPCCWPPTAIAATAGEPASAHAASKADHQAPGSCSLRGGVVGGCGARPTATTVPVSASRTSTLVDCVELSTPATRGTAGSGSRAGRQRTPRSSSTTSWSSRSLP